MILTELSVENFGVFRGRHVFDLRTGDGQKPIIIFGGKNGAGKTTLFEGIKLCLYGPNFRGSRLNRPEYEQYLSSRIHRRFGLAESEGSSVGLEFEHAHQGRSSTYSIRRRWTESSGSVKEVLDVFRNGKPLDDVSEQQAQDFLIDLIPLGLSKLFFFDGELIQKLAEDQPDNRSLIDAFNSLLGVDVLEHLQTDMRIHLSKKLRELSSPTQSYETLAEEERALEFDATVLRQSNAQKQSEIDQVMSEIERREHELASEGGGFADRRLYLKARKTEVQTEITTLEGALRDLAGALLPFAIVPALGQSVKERLLKEEVDENALAAESMIRGSMQTLNTKLMNEDFWRNIPIDTELRGIVLKKIVDLLDSILAPTRGERKFVHRLSPSDRERIIHWIEVSQNWVPAQLRSTTTALEEKIREFQTLEDELSRVPPDEAVSPLIQKLNSLHQKLGELNHDKGLIDEKLHQLEYRLNEKRRNSGRLLEEQRGLQAMRQGIELGKQVQQTLAEFAKSLRDERTRVVSERFVEVFNQLMTKRNMISAMKIDPATFSTFLFRQNGTSVPKESLSAGEKQLYAIAMLTALARVSGKPLPFVIDTPLARLDANHRTNLVAQFFPSASHQVVVFSTDSEIDKSHFAKLKPHIAKAYLLQYEDSSESTSVSSGYFWENILEVAA
jgi:DNA sulfur modification protein DndD